MRVMQPLLIASLISLRLPADIYYSDREGGADDEYLTLGVDHEPLFNGRTALQLYTDYMSSLEQTFHAYLQKGTINQIQVGMGPAGTSAPFNHLELTDGADGFSPAGELRYPSYQLSKWSYCGIGECVPSSTFVPSVILRRANDAWQVPVLRQIHAGRSCARRLGGRASRVGPWRTE